MLRALSLAGIGLAWLGASAQNIVSGEYWVDIDPGWGQGNPIIGMPAQADVTNHQFAVPTSALSSGLHIVGIRTKDALGHWSLTNTKPLYVNAALDAADIVRTVYFWNTDSGWSSGTDVGIDGNPDVTGTVTASLTGTTPGLNNLFVRSKDANGHWSVTNTVPVYVDPPDSDAPIVRTEYFWNSDPGWGLGTDAALQGQPDVNDVVAANSDDAVQGLNNLFVRARDAHGHWSLTRPVPIYAEASSDGVIVAAESFWDADPGFGQGDPVQGWTSGADVSGAFGVAVPIDIGLGLHQLFIRTLDSHGHWSLTNWKVDLIDVDGTTNSDDLTAQLGLSAYPNPFTEGFMVRSRNQHALRAVLYDPQGKLVHDNVIRGQSYIDLSQHSRGTYTALFWTENGRILRTTMIKQ